MLPQPLTEQEVIDILSKRWAEFSLRMPAETREGVFAGYRDCPRGVNKSASISCTECRGSGLVDAEPLPIEKQLCNWERVAATLLIELTEARDKITTLFRARSKECVACATSKAFHDEPCARSELRDAVVGAIEALPIPEDK
jgi:hypothetical protein